jgi:type IV secretion system protein TrbL
MMSPLSVPGAVAGEGCGFWDAECHVAAIGQTLVETVANTAMSPIAEMFMNGWMQLEMLFFASWVAMPLLVDVTDPNGTVAWLQGILTQFTFVFAVMGALVTSGYMFIKLGAERLRVLGWRMLLVLGVSIGGAVVIASLDLLARQASVWVLTQVGVTAAGLATNAVVTGAATAISPGITLIIGIVAVIGVLIQWGIMIARGPLVVLLLGLWPMTAAAATIGGQKAEASFERVSAWLFAFVLYPFPAALVYAAAFRLKGGDDGIGGIMYGFVLQVLAIFLLPAILRIVAPQTKILGEKFGGQIAAKAAIGAAETAVAVGAAVVTAGALSGMIAGKVAAGASSAASSASGSAGGASAGGTSGGGASSSTGASAASPDAAAAGQTNGAGADEKTSQSGASTVSADTAAPSTSTASGAGAPAPDRGAPSTPASETPAKQSAPSSTPAMQSPPSSEPATKDPTPRAQGQRAAAAAQMGAQAAQAASSGAGRAAREALDDADDIIGGRE